MRRRRFRLPLAKGGLLLLGGLLAGVLALLLKDFVRESILVPLAYTVSGARVALNVLPQVVWWLAFLLVTLFIVVGGVLAALPASRRSGASDEPRPGRVEKWMRWIDLAAGGGDNYSQQNLARRVRDLALGALAARDGSASPSTALRSPRPTGAGSAAEGAHSQVSEIDIEPIVRYLEDEMEIARGG
jgi:hypothetical protein